MSQIVSPLVATIRQAKAMTPREAKAAMMASMKAEIAKQPDLNSDQADVVDAMVDPQGAILANMRRQLRNARAL